MAIEESLQEQIVVGMFDRGLLGFPEGGVELKSGRLSPYYYNDRPSLSFSRELAQSNEMSIEQQREFRKALVGGYAVMLSELESNPFHIFGKAQAATATAAVGAYVAGKSYLWERIDEPNKRYGYHRKIEGTYMLDETVGLADDVVTDGQSKIEGAEVLVDAGLLPVSVTLKFDREEGGVQTLEEFGYEVNMVVGLSKAVVQLRENGRIGNKEIDDLYAYHEGLKNDDLVTTFSLPEDL